MDTDDIAPPPAGAPKIKLDEMSIEDLQDHVAALKDEIARAEDMISVKKRALGDADSVFKI